MEKAFEKSIKWVTKNKSTFVFTISVIVVTVSLLIVGYSSCVKEHFGLNSNNFGQLGDFFNGIAAPVLSLITIILLYNSFLVQKEELKTASKALEESVKEMAKSAAIMERTEQNAKLERLESICFKLLDKYENSRDKFRINSGTAQVIPYEDIQALKRIHATYLSPVNELSFKVKVKVDQIKVEKNTILEMQDVDDCLNYIFDSLKKETYFEELKSLVDKFIAIYKCIDSSGLNYSLTEDLVFAIDTQVSKEELFFIKLFINQNKDLISKTFYSATATSELIYWDYLNTVRAL